MATAAGTPPIGIAAALSFLAGVCTCLWLPWLVPWWLSLIFLCVAGRCLWRGVQSSRLREIVPGWWLAGMALAGLHAAHALALQLPAAPARHDAVVTGRILDLPEHEPRRTRFLFRVDDNVADARLRGRDLRLAWYEDDPARRSALRAGQHWRFDVRLRAPRGLRNPGGADAEKFAMAQRLSAMGYVRSPGTARLLASAHGVDAWRDGMSERIATGVHRPSSRFVRALALGDVRGLADADWTVLRANGLTHLIAISGFHVGLVAGFFALFVRAAWWTWPNLARRVPAPIAAAAASVVGAALYTAMAGFALPTVRTALMIAIVAGLRGLRRRIPAGECLALAAFAMLLVDPLSALSAGFWLSFAGVAWLLWCLPENDGSAVRDFLSAQGVASLGLLPVAAILFGQASLAGPLANLVAVPWWSLAVVPLSLFGLGLESLHAGAGEWAWKLAAWCFDLSWPLFEWLAASPLSLWWLPESRWFALPLALLGAFWLLLPRGTPGKSLAALLWLPLLWPDRRLPAPGEAELLVIDVGQGQSVLVRTARHTLLVDMGPAVPDGFDAGERAVIPVLHALGVPRLDAAVVSHGDNDHAGGWPAVAALYSAPRLFAPEGIHLPGSRPCLAGAGWTWDGVRFRFLHPPLDFPYLGNESSCVLRIEAEARSALIAGDIGEVIERRLVRERPADVQADVVLVAHHGSGGSSDPAFVAATGATQALVSTGHGNRFGHPRPFVVERWQRAGAAVHDTAMAGALRVRLGRDGVDVEARRQAHPRLWDAARRGESRSAGLSYREDRGGRGPEG
ncbi:DNA internalization-related competence protein ComEC/Rec2 [Lysobacter sp. UC]|uniref:DNA internalization-related competence protein ComEC/Rec2 n=1 Tax=Lysobacter arvi TaxID=3038776 RepID=A0ABU1C934_9GAMM|nr:DNA internalization-related competence protein ComEC/Rec2 [Lysobacter arvi]MDR0181643.1 DNA internalization-related competence protein ComEC/Rec2 [Lysobacter arvi]